MSERADDRQGLLLTAAVATRLTRHPNQALTVHHPDLAYRPHTDTDDLTTTAPSVLDHVRGDLAITAPSALNHDLAITEPPAPDHVRDDLNTTEPSALERVRDLTTTATAIANVLEDNPEILFRHWHPAVPFPGAAVAGAAEAAKASSC